MKDSGAIHATEVKAIPTISNKFAYHCNNILLLHEFEIKINCVYREQRS